MFLYQCLFFFFFFFFFRRTQEIEREGEAVNRRSEEDRVNYGYHPIIDFFDSYSSDPRQR